MTDEELRRLAEAARQFGSDWHLWRGGMWSPQDVLLTIPGLGTGRAASAANEETAAYIAAACNAVPGLLDLLRAAEAENARLRWALQDIEQIGGANKLYMPSAIARDALKEPTP